MLKCALIVGLVEREMYTYSYETSLNTEVWSSQFKSVVKRGMNRSKEGDVQ